VRGVLRPVVAAGLIAAAVVLGWRSGDQPSRDVRAIAERQLGIPLEARRVDVGEVSLHVILAGPEAGPPVVLLHGFPEFWYTWSPAIAPLTAAGFRVVVPDQRGYDESDKPTEVEAYGVERLAGDIAGLIDALGFENAFVAGQDWGGAVAWQLAMDHPDRVRGLAILDTPHPNTYRRTLPFEDSSFWSRALRPFVELPGVPEWSSRACNWLLMTRIIRGTARPGVFSDETLDLYRSAWDRDGAWSAMLNWHRAAWRDGRKPPLTARVRVPTLLLLAPHDPFIPAAMTRASLDFLDHGRLVELSEGTHWVLQENPAEVTRALVAFFARQ
jgi:pimeloyl-ACP methyl ester carboxylesterase